MFKPLSPRYCVVASTAASNWFLQDFENDYAHPRFAWSISANEAHLFGRHEEAVALAQIVKHSSPDLHLKILEARHSRGMQ